MQRHHLSFLVGLVILFAIPSPVSAQLFKPSKGPAHTDPPSDDPNYGLMGEFVGQIANGEGEEQPLGLQIRPVGNDQFDAVSFFGGLPGQDAHEPEPMRMIGQRSGDFLVLSGGPWAIFVERDSCLILDRTGEKVGRLERIERSSPTLGARPPGNAVVLFDGTGTDQFTKAEMTDAGLLKEGADLKPMFQDFNLHLEFRLPYMPSASDQARGNSGVYLQSRYECQVLDSFGQDPVHNGCGALYRFRAPDLNMCLPPLVWQTYDIQFTAPRWAADGSKIRDAHITSWLNGVKVHDNVALPNQTGAGKEEAPTLLPIRLQDHRDPVRYRNVWLIDRGLAIGEFPIYPTPEQILEDARAEREAAEKLKESETDEASESAADDDPSNDDPSNDDPSNDDPSNDDPSSDDPSSDDPSSDEPSSDEPGSDEPSEAKGGEKEGSEKEGAEPAAEAEASSDEAKAE